MKQELRMILAVVISVGIIFVFNTFIAPKQAEVLTPPTITAATNGSTTTPVVTPQQPATNTAIDPSFVATPRELTVNTPKFVLTLNTVGGDIRGFALKDFKATAEKASPDKDLIKETPDSYALFLGLKGYPALTPDKVFQVTKDTELPNGGRQIALAWQDKNVRVEKTFVIGGESTSYAFTMLYKVVNRGTSELNITPYIETRLRQKDIVLSTGILSKFSREQPDYYGGVYFKGDSLFIRGGVDSDSAKSFKRIGTPPWTKFDPVFDSGAVAWTGITDRYFLIATASVVDANNLKAQTGVGFDRSDDFLLNRYYAAPVALTTGQAVSQSLLSYMGPKQRTELASVGILLEKAVDYGWFDRIAVLILGLMALIHKVIPNWGLVILTLTFLVKMALYPVNKKSLKSMKAMQLLQPKLAEIKKRYPDNPQKQNEEVMQLFRTHKVNPLGGCLPMILQMPIYIALYKVLWNAIELYHSPFLWYKDLSAPDPFFIAPVLLGIFMFLQQKLTPSASADPAQQKMMMFMPVMFCVFMLFLPVGLVIYIFVNTFMSVIQQFMLQRDLSFKDMVTGNWRLRSST